MKTMCLAAAALLAISTGSVFAASADPGAVAFNTATTCPQQGIVPTPHNNQSNNLVAKAESHNAWGNNGLNGGGG